MRVFLQILRGLEVALGVCLTLAVLLVSNENWGILYLLVIFVWINALPVLIGLWALIFRPALRRLAAWVTLLPVAFLVVPMTIRTAMGNPVDSRVLLFLGIAVGVAVLLLTLISPQSVAARLPAALFRSRAWNVLLLALQVLGGLLALAAVAAAGPALLDTSSGQGSPGMGGATLLIMTVGWFIGVALTSVSIAAWSWLGLHGCVEGALRKLHIAQLVVASPGLLIAALFLFKLPIFG